ncbi:MAG: DUF1549 domain-containing protein [Acidimicrobiia bacterium]|nr:DUF1549 domain-containing protein [Acidimicrobiia bacterium]
MIALLLLAATVVAHPLDGLLEKYARGQGVVVAGAVSDAAFARRVHLDLWGLLPTPEQVAAFEQDKRADKREALVEKLLANRVNFAHHWITFWNDHLRNDEGVVYHGDRKSITPWLRKALEENLPYDRFVQALLNPVAKDDPDGFLTGVNWRGDISASQTPVMQAAQNSAQVFLGVNLKCNSCHDSFISKWKLADAYALAAFFSEEPLEMHRCDVALGQKAAPKFLYPELGDAGGAVTLEEKRARVASLFTKPENGRTPRTYVNRVWKVVFGRGLVEPPDTMEGKAWSAEILDWLAEDFVAHGQDTNHLLKRIMTSRAYQLPAVSGEAEKAYVFRGPQARRLTAEQFLDAVSSITGEWRLLKPRQAGAAAYARDWQLKSTALGRSMGRPIRDQVVTERINQPTTLAALELVNGETLSDLLYRGALRMQGKLPAAPANLFDSGVVSSAKAPVDVDITGAKKLYLVLEDVDSYDPARVVAGWAGARLVGPEGERELAEAVNVKAPSTLVIDVAGKSYTRFQATAGVDPKSLESDISPRLRFFVFTEEPDRQRMMPVKGEPPVPAPAGFSVERVYRHALGRAPKAKEKRIAAGMLPEDLLWALVVSEEFQYIR